MIEVAVLCSVLFSHDHQREDGTLMQEDDYHHELWINDIKKPLTIVDVGINKRTTLIWWEDGQCPPCEQIKMTTIDSEDRRSVFSDNACTANPNPPGICL